MREILPRQSVCACSVVQFPFDPVDGSLPGSLRPYVSGKNTGVGMPSSGDLPRQAALHLLHRQVDSLPLVPSGKVGREGAKVTKEEQTGAVPQDLPEGKRGGTVLQLQVRAWERSLLENQILLWLTKGWPCAFNITFSLQTTSLRELQRMEVFRRGLGLKKLYSPFSPKMDPRWYFNGVMPS